MARMIHKRPKWVVETGMQVLKYLHGSMGWGLNYTRIDDPTVLNVLVDASYAPPHEGYRSVQGAIYMHGSNVLMWSSSRQGFITQSTAEAELLAYNESAQGAESVAHLLECFEQKVARRLIGDSKSGLVQLTGEVGSWRTRHLRLRSAKLRELIQHGIDGWHAVHRDGKDLAADGMTKPLAGQAFVRFRDMLFMKDCGSFDVEKNIKSAPAIKTCTQERPGMYLRDLGCGLVGAGSALLMTGHKKLALMLVASGAALYWSKEGKRPASKAIEQRPQKSPEKEGGKDQKYLGKGGAAHLKDEDRAGTIKKEVSKLRKDQEEAVVSRSPGLRALRSGDRRASHGTSSNAASSQEQDVAGPFPAGALFEDSSGLMSQAQSNRQKVQADEKMKEELTKEANRRIRALEERVDALVTDNASYVASNPMPTPMSSTRMVEDGMQRALVPPSRPYRALDGTVEPPGVHQAVMGSDGAWNPPPGLSQTVFGGHPSTSWSRPTARAGSAEVRRGPTVANERPSGSVWGVEQYQYCPTGHDRWDLSKLQEGWIIRCHGRARKRRFHPLHGFLPVPASDLDGLRITKRFIRGGGADVFQDLWTDENKTRDNATWGGYTFLKMKQSTASSSSQHVDRTHVEDSDGSYEVIGSEQPWA